MPFEAEQHAVPLERLCCFLGICIHWRQVRNHTSACFIRWRYEMQAVIHVGEESEPYVKLLVQKRVDLAIKIVETWQTEQLKALLTEWKKDHPAELKAA